MKNRYSTPLIIVAVVTILWLAALPYFYEIFFSKLFYMPFVGSVAAIVANITPAAAGIVYFPILTHLNVSPTTVSQFNLIIQAYGMGLGTFRWFLFNKKLFIFNVIPISIAGGFIGEIVSIVFFPIQNPEMLTLIFNFISFLFTQIIFISLLRNSKYPNTNVVLTPLNLSVMFFFSFLGGLLCGWIGFGIDTIFYFIMTMLFRINPAASIVTSIALMAAMSISGTVLNAIFHEIPLELWYSAIPGVTIGGLFLAAYIAVKMGARNILLLFTFFLSIDFFAALWTQQTIPISETLRKSIIYVLVLYMLFIHIKIFRNQSKNINNSSMGEFSCDDK
ncbi:MAG: sulfite exporter TauE/SafE family protein [Desulfamplus sp.]|nr:sulfite exporter TauE/SafE family protein [Desulfamplus sp.]MBF0390383.1 sulfite exporter TauE/SafE family protein [Desulfamplus sp.]